MKKRSNLKVMVSLIGLVKPLVGYMILAISMGLIGHLCATFITVLGTQVVVNVIHANVWSVGLLVCIVVFGILRGILRYGEQACNHFIAFKLLALIRDKVFMALRRLCPAKLDGKDKGNLISIITSDIELLEVFYAHTISPIAIAITFGIVMCLYIGQFHVAFGVLAFMAYLCVGGIVPVMISKMSQDVGMKFRSKSGALSSFVLDSLRGLKELMQYDAGKQRIQQLHEKSLDLSEDERVSKQIMGRNMAITNTTILVFDIAMVFMGAYLYLQQAVTFDGVLLSTIALMSSFGPFVALANLGSTLQNTFAAGNRVLDILEETPVIDEITGKEKVSFTGMQVEDVTFAYQDEVILKNVSLDVQENQVIGLVGKSGSGKSTLLKLMMRFWKPQQGNLSISGNNLEDINTTNLRDMQGYMTQETYLFQDTIANNLRVAKWDATEEEMIEACKKAAIHDFIMTLPKGYDTPVGELGDTLSGGQRQRLGLARAFLHDAPMLLLDEPTSNVDSLNEAIILRSIKNEEKKRTVVLVTHRPSTLRIADTVYKVENGRMS